MKSFNKTLGAVLAAAFAASMIVAPASASSSDNRGTHGVGIFPALLGPVGAAAAFGPTTTTAVWHSTLNKKLFFYKYNKYGWYKVKKLYKAGYDLKFYKKGKFVKVKGSKKVRHSRSNKSINGKAVVGCIMGSALGAITASIRKGTAMGNPPRWRSQAEHEKILASGYEKQFELTNDEAATAVALCGLGSFALHWQQAAPAVTARY